MNEHNEYEITEKEMNYKDRIMACYEMVSAFKNSEMIKSLIGCTPVRNPIRKTNMIKREPNFQKALILWDALDEFEYRDPKVVNYENKIDSSKETKDEFTLGYFIDCNAVDDTKENLMQYKDVDAKLKKLINEYIYEKDQDINTLKERANEYYDIAIKEKEIRISNITNIYNNFLTNHDKKLETLLKIFD